MYDTPEAYPGHREDIHMMEYDQIKDIINAKYGTKSTSLEIRSEFLVAVNKVFTSMISTDSHQAQNIMTVMVDVFNVSEDHIFRCLNDDNREKLRNFAINNYETSYYQNIEERNMRQKMEEQGKKFFKTIKTDDLFE